MIRKAAITAAPKDAARDAFFAQAELSERRRHYFQVDEFWSSLSVSLSHGVYPSALG